MNTHPMGLVLASSLAAGALADVSCVEPDDGNGTIQFPAACPYDSAPDVMRITDGFPAGTRIEILATLEQFDILLQGPGGNLGGEFQQFNAILVMTMSGTGDLANFNRFIQMPVFCETNTGPRPAADTQPFQTELVLMSGQIQFDPDFDVISVLAGSKAGLPSPGHTTLFDFGDSFFVHSFFYVQYEIDFVGAAGSLLDGFGGPSKGFVDMRQGFSEPKLCTWDCSGDNDNNVGIVDFLALLAQWGGPGPCDFDGGGVGIVDLLKLLANWGSCGPALPVCGDATGGCFDAHPTPGCDNELCCRAVCHFDIFCCVAEWDQLCTQLASALCTQ